MPKNDALIKCVMRKLNTTLTHLICEHDTDAFNNIMSFKNSISNYIMENKYDIRVNRTLYKRMVQQKNFTENLNIQCSQTAISEIPTNSDLYGTSAEIYQYNCSKDTISSLKIICGYKALQFDVSGIQYSMDKAVYNMTPGGPTALVAPTMNSTFPNLNIMVDNNLGIASPLNFMFLCSDPINALANTDVKVGNFESKSQVTDTQLDFFNRMFSADDLRHSENFLMLPDETNSYNYNNKKALYSEAKKIYYSGADAQSAGFDYSQIIAEAKSVGAVECAVQSDIQKLKYDKLNSQSLINRGQQQIDPSTLTFSKAMASPNYTYNATTDTFAPSASVTTLFTIKYGNNYYPSNISQADFEKSGIALCHALFFYDKNNELAFNNFYGRTQTPPLATEQPGQSLSMSFQYKNIEGPVLNEITVRKNNYDTISNISSITVTRNLRSDPSAIIKCLLPYSSELTGQAHQTSTLNITSANYPSMKGVTTTVNRIGGYIKVQQFVLPIGLTMPAISSHPYTKMEIVTEDISKVLLGGRTWKDICTEKGKLQFEMTSKNFAKVPTGMALWVNVRNQNDIKNRHGSTNRRAEITNYQLKVGQSPYNFSDRNKKVWFDVAKHNGLENYEYNGFCEKKYIEAYEPKSVSVASTNGGGNLDIIDNFTLQSIIKTKSHTNSFSNGNFIFYRFDDDIPLPDGYSANTISFNRNLQHKLELYCEDPDSTFAEINYIYFYDHQLLCDATSAISVVDMPLYFTPEQVGRAIDKVNENIKHDVYTSKISNVGYGSGLFKSTLDKVKSKLPSMHRVREIVKNVEPLPERKTESTTGGAASRPRTMRDFFKQ